MKNKTIKLFATQIPYTEEELEENVVYVEFNVEELLDQIKDIITDFEKFKEDDSRDLIEELEYRGHNFSKQIGEKDCIEFLEDSGYTITYNNQEIQYDYVDNCLFEDIVNKFDSLDCFSRQKMRDLIINL